MINLLILYDLNNRISTMYGISAHLKKEFSVILTPSFGTISPALKKLEKNGCITSQRHISKGGRPSVYYAITDKGKQRLTEELLASVTDNPSQFLNNARVRLYCSDILSDNDRKNLLEMLKLKAMNIKIDTEKLLEKHNKNFYPRMVFDNMNLELKNFITLLEGIERACKN